MTDLILAIDQGTTGSTALLLDDTLTIRGRGDVDFPQHFPQPSWVEHDLGEVWGSVTQAIRKAIDASGTSAKDIVAIGITNQRETTCLWQRDDEATPVGKAIVWQDRRTAAHCEALRAKGHEKLVTKRTGLLLDPYFSATKLAWMLKNGLGLKGLAKKGRLLFGTIDSYLAFKLTGQHVTEPSNASRTLLMNLRTGDWDEELLDLFDVPRALLPAIKPSAGEFGRTRGVPGIPDGIPVAGIAGDQQAALFGQACFSVGAAKATYGTGAFVLANVGSEPLASQHRLLTSVAWRLGDKTTYCLEGSAFIAGAVVQWLRDQLGLISSSEEVEKLAASVPDSDGVVFVPGLSGMGAPHWLPRATGMVTGITRRTSRGHLARAALEGIAFQVRELIEAMAKDLGRKIRSLKVDGGAAENSLLMQYQADLLGVDVVRAAVGETTALGAALLAGLGVGWWKDTKEIEKAWRARDSFAPKITPAVRRKEIERWNRAMAAVKLLSQNATI